MPLNLRDHIVDLFDCSMPQEQMMGAGRKRALEEEDGEE
jgi:hypothetical protein